MTMMKMFLPKCVAALAVAGLMAGPLTGCAAIERATGLNTSTQMGAVSGAAAGGVLAALLNANPGWIAASAVLGGVAGSVIGNNLRRQNAERHARVQVSALDTLGQGQTQSWSDPTSGSSGRTTITKVTSTTDGHVCKSFRETVRTPAESVTREATACKDPDRAWKVMQS